jgi:hypothetical protein
MMTTTPQTTLPSTTEGAAPLATAAPEVESKIVLPTVSQQRALAFEPTNFNEAREVARMVASVQLCGCASEAEAMGKIMLGAQLGWSVMVSLMNLFAISTPTGPKLGMYASAARALAMAHPACEYLKCTEATPEKATYVIKRKGYEEVTRTWTKEDSARAGLVDRGEKKDGKSTNNHDKYPTDMNIARASIALIRQVIPEALMGVSTVEELQAEPTKVEMTVVRQAQARDFANERAGIKAEIERAKTAEEKKACRRAIKVLADDGQDVSELTAFYSSIHGDPKNEKKEAAPAAPPATGTQGA